jgi:hypothetical protein
MRVTSCRNLVQICDLFLQIKFVQRSHLDKMFLFQVIVKNLLLGLIRRVLGRWELHRDITLGPRNIIFHHFLYLVKVVSEAGWVPHVEGGQHVATHILLVLSVAVHFSHDLVMGLASVFVWLLLQNRSIHICHGSILVERLQLVIVLHPVSVYIILAGDRDLSLRKIIVDVFGEQFLVGHR